MKYNLVLFDLDDTLLCYQTAEKYAFKKTMQDHGVTENLDVIFKRYKEINKKLWRELESSTIPKETVRLRRFESLKKEFDLNTINVEKASVEYLVNLTHVIEHIPEAEEVCKSLFGRVQMIIITNGFKEVSSKRVEKSLLKPYIDHVVTSDCTGAAKPSLEIFRHAFSLAKNFDPQKTVIVGDTLETDVLGAHRAGIDSAWFNPIGKPKDMDIEPTYTIKNLKEIYNILKWQ